MSFVIATPAGARYSTTGSPEGVVYFDSRSLARAKLKEVTPEMPSKCLPLRVVEVDRADEPRFTDEEVADAKKRHDYIWNELARPYEERS